MGAFAPVPVDYAGPVAEQYVAVGADPTMWLVAHAVFLVGVALTAGGVYVLADLFEDPSGRRLAVAAVTVNALAVVAFAVVAYYRVTLPGSSATVPPLFEAAMGGWLYASYLVLSLGSFALLGAALITGSTMRRSAGSRWGSVSSGSQCSLVGDLPPFLFYLVTAPAGVWIFRQAGRVADPDESEHSTARPS